MDMSDVWIVNVVLVGGIIYMLFNAYKAAKNLYDDYKNGRLS